MAKVKKSEIDLEKQLVEVTILLKGFPKPFIVNTTAKECCDLVDWLNENRAYSKVDEKFFIINDYVKKKTLVFEKAQIKYFEIPFFIDDGEENYDVKVLTYQA